MRTISCTPLVLLALAVLTGGAAENTGIRSIDFKNFSFPWNHEVAFADRSTWHWIASRPKALIRVEKGIHHFYKPDQSDNGHKPSPRISVDAVTYGDLDGDGSEEAAVHLNYSTGGTQNWDYLYVYKLVGGRTQLIGLLISAERGYGGLVGSIIQKGLLVLDFADPERRVGDCCSEGYIRVHYRWRNGAFLEEGPRERGDLNLNER